MDARDRRWIAGVSGLAFLLRLLLILMTPVIGADAGVYLIGAAEMARGLWTPTLEIGIHPGYPFAICLAAPLLGTPEAAGYAVSVLASSLSVGVFYVFARDLLPARAARIAALLYACLPYYILEHADIMTEGLFHLFFLSSVTAAWYAVRRGAPLLHLLAGVCGGLALLTRPEGIYAPAAHAGLALLAAIGAWRRKAPLPWKGAAFALAGLLAFLVVASPYLLWIRQSTGRWHVTKRPSADRVSQGLAGQEEKEDVAPGRAAGWAPSLRQYANGVLRVTMYLLPLALLAARYWRGRIPALAVAYLLCLAAGYSVAPIAARASGWALSFRHLLLPALFLLPFVAIGLEGLAERLALRWRHGARAAAVAFALFLVLAALRAVHPRRADELPVREASLWLRANAPADARIRANTRQVMYYAGRRTAQLPERLAELEARPFEPGDFLLVIEKDYEKALPGGLAFLEGRHRRIARFPPEETRGQERVSVFAVQKAP